MIRRVAAAVAVLALAAFAATPTGLVRWRCLSMETRLQAHKCCQPPPEDAGQARLGRVCCEREAERTIEPILDGRTDGDTLLASVTSLAALPIGTVVAPIATLPTPRGRGSPPPPLLDIPTETVVFRI
jgi:hypothetical protein